VGGRDTHLGAAEPHFAINSFAILSPKKGTEFDSRASGGIAVSQRGDIDYSGRGATRLGRDRKGGICDQPASKLVFKREVRVITNQKFSEGVVPEGVRPKFYVRMISVQLRTWIAGEQIYNRTQIVTSQRMWWGLHYTSVQNEYQLRSIPYRNKPTHY
jgi:hypothetical protein